MPHVPSSRVNPPSARSWQRLARRIGKCSPKRVDRPATVCPNRRRQFLALHFGKCSSLSLTGSLVWFYPWEPRRFGGVAWVGVVRVRRPAQCQKRPSSALRVMRKRKETWELGFPGFWPSRFGNRERCGQGELFVIKQNRSGNTQDVPRKLEKGSPLEKHKQLHRWTRKFNAGGSSRKCK